MSSRIALVLLPGLDGTGLLFKPLIEALPAFLDPIVVSYPPDSELDYDALLPLVTCALPGEAQFLLLGESFSGPLALRAAATKPANLRGVILCASFITNPVPYLPAWTKTLVRPFLFCRLPATANAKIILGCRADPALRALHRRALSQVHPCALAARARSALRVNVTEELARCPTPVLYLQATRDWVVPRRNLSAILSANPTVSVVTFAAPHMLLQTRPTEAARAIARFADDVAAG